MRWTRRPCRAVFVLLVMIGSAWGAGGDIDPTFGVGGFVEHAIPGNRAPDAWTRFAVDASGRIVMARRVPSYTLELRRFLPDGAADPTFGVGGVATVVTPSLTDAAAPEVVLLDETDGIVVRTIRWLVRVDATGAVVPGFGSGGVETALEMGGLDGVLTPDGVVIAGDQCVSRCPRMTTLERRRLTDGSLDPGFGTAGTVTHVHGTLNRSPQVGRQSDGSLVLSSGGQLIRYFADGTRDPAFGASSGATALPLDGACDLAVLADDRIVVALGKHAIARFTADGMPDATFGTGGVSRVASVLHQSDTDNDGCRLLVAADDTATVVYRVWEPAPPGGYSRVVRFTAAGEIDPGFAPCGFAVPAGLVASEAAQLPDGQVLLMGHFKAHDEYQGELARLRFARLGTPSASSCLPAVPGTARDRRRGNLSARWKVDGDVPLSAFGDPLGASGYVLCILPDMGYLVGDVNGILPLAGGTLCSGKPCWRGLSKGFLNREYGVTRLTAGTAGRGRIAVNGGVKYGLSLSTLPVTLRLDRIDGPECWEASFPRIE
jgi:uncharacterized delta-60 repeat protein